MKQRIRKFNGYETRTVRVPSVFYPQCDHLAVLLTEGYTLEGVIRDSEGRVVRQVQYLQTGIEDRDTTVQVPSASALVLEAENNNLETASQVVPAVAIAPPVESDKVMSQIDAPAFLSRDAREVAVTSVTLIADASPIASVVPEAIALWQATPSEEISRYQAFGKRLFRVWRSLALEKSRGNETPWNCDVEIEDVYRQAFSTMQGTAFLAYLSNLEGQEISFGGVLQLNPLEAGGEGLEMNGRAVSTLTFTLTRRALIPVVSQATPFTVTLNPEASDTANADQFANPVTHTASQCNGLRSRLQRFRNRLIPRTF